MGGPDEQKYDHPTQKPVNLMRRPILNHTKRGVQRWQTLAGKSAVLDGDGRAFEEIAEERRNAAS